MLSDPHSCIKRTNWIGGCLHWQLASARPTLARETNKSLRLYPLYLICPLTEFPYGAVAETERKAEIAQDVCRYSEKRSLKLEEKQCKKVFAG